MSFLDQVVNASSVIQNHVFNKKSYLSSIQQRFTSGEPQNEMIDQGQFWTFSVPNEISGPCLTYDPPHDSDPGRMMGIFIRMNFTKWDPNLQIFLHKKGKFFYTDNATDNTIKLEEEKMKSVWTGHPRISGNTPITKNKTFDAGYMC